MKISQKLFTSAKPFKDFFDILLLSFFLHFCCLKTDLMMCKFEDILYSLNICYIIQIYVLLDVKGQVVLDIDCGKGNAFPLDCWLEHNFKSILLNLTYAFRFVKMFIIFLLRLITIEIVYLILLINRYTKSDSSYTRNKFESYKARYVVISRTLSFIIILRRTRIFSILQFLLSLLD